VLDEFVIGLFERHPILATILAGLVAAHGLALFIVNLTPTPKDNEIVMKLYRVVEYVAGIVSPKAKEGEEWRQF
jgi:hypothetical protein